MYQSLLNKFETEDAIKMVKDVFQVHLVKQLNLHRMTAPLFVLSGLGLNDDLSGHEKPVSFLIKDMDGQKAEIVHSLAKWKRVMLGQYNMQSGQGIYTDMSAIRTEEHLDNLHSLYVDQWDWEKVISKQNRNIEYLQQEVSHIYTAILETEQELCRTYTMIQPFLPPQIKFISSEELLQMYPLLTPQEREKEVCKQYGAVFISGIGGELSDGSIHDMRSADYDDWSTLVGKKDGKPIYGLNGDILIWYPVLNHVVELSSMGIRVDANALNCQLQLKRQIQKKQLYYHQLVLNNNVPLSIGGGIGQSRLCMVLLHKVHIGEVQASIWPQDMREQCLKDNVELI